MEKFVSYPSERRTVSAIELFGIAAVTVMVITYAHEERAATYVLAFSLSCLAAAIYAILIRAWPFAGVETIWSVIAFQRWRRRRSSGDNEIGPQAR